MSFPSQALGGGSGPVSCSTLTRNGEGAWQQVIPRVSPRSPGGPCVVAVVTRLVVQMTCRGPERPFPACGLWFGFFSGAPPLCLHVMCVISSPAQIGAAGFLEVPAPPNGLCLSCRCLIVPPHTPKLHLPRPSRRTAGRVAGQTPCLACWAAFRVCAGSPARRLGGRAGGRRSDDPQTARELARAAAPAQRRASPQPGPRCRQARRIH